MERIKESLKLIGEDIINYKWFLIAIPVYLIIVSLLFDGFCPIYGAFHIHCPGCGMTRAVAFLLMGDFKESFNMHPLAGLWVAFALYLFVCRYVIRKKPKGIVIILAIICVLMIIVYIYRIYVYGGEFLY